MASLNFVQVDNRQFSYQSFASEASHASFHRYVENLIGKIITLSTRHNWISKPSCILVAQSPEKCRLVHGVQLDASAIGAIVEPLYTCVGGNAVPKVTWGTYLLDGLQKVSQIIRQKHKESKETPKCQLIVFTTDKGALGDQYSDCIDGQLQKYCSLCSELTQFADIQIRIICTTISDKTYSTFYENANLLALHARFKALKGAVTFQQIHNSAMHYEEELRAIIAGQQVPLLSKMQFPVIENVECSLLMELTAGTLSGVSSLHGGMSRPELCSLVPRGQLNPLFIEGRSCVVKCPVYKATRHTLTCRAR